MALHITSMKTRRVLRNPWSYSDWLFFIVESFEFAKCEAACWFSSSLSAEIPLVMTQISFWKPLRGKLNLNTLRCCGHHISLTFLALSILLESDKLSKAQLLSKSCRASHVVSEAFILIEEGVSGCVQTCSTSLDCNVWFRWRLSDKGLTAKKLEIRFE